MKTVTSKSIKENLTHIHSLISKYEQKYGRKSNSVQLLAVSKGQSLEKIQAAYEAGQHDFGENHLQEAMIKIGFFCDKTIVWHFIGNIQSNKVKKIAEHFDWVHSIDSMKIAKRLNDYRSPPLSPLNICIEVNVSNEANKSGISIDEVLPLAGYCQTLPHLRLRGLMTIPAEIKDFKQQQEQFHKVYECFEALRAEGFDLDTLSMGMSSDFEAAISEGSTLVRLGTIIFGPREKFKMTRQEEQE